MRVFVEDTTEADAELQPGVRFRIAPGRNKPHARMMLSAGARNLPRQSIKSGDRVRSIS
jgi:hypothetical protein